MNSLITAIYDYYQSFTFLQISSSIRQILASNPLQMQRLISEKMDLTIFVKFPEQLQAALLQLDQEAIKPVVNAILYIYKASFCDETTQWPLFEKLLEEKAISFLMWLNDKDSNELTSFILKVIHCSDTPAESVYSVIERNYPEWEYCDRNRHNPSAFFQLTLQVQNNAVTADAATAKPMLLAEATDPAPHNGQSL